MFLEHFASGSGNNGLPERKPEIRSSKGYPEVRDPAAENPRGILQQNLGEAGIRKLRQHYGPALKM